MNSRKQYNQPGGINVFENQKPQVPPQMQKPTENSQQNVANSQSRDKTEILKLPHSPKPMTEREPGNNTKLLAFGWSIIFRIGDQSRTLPLRETIIVGRAVDTDNEREASLDLTPFGAYHYGVSRRHATMSLNEGYLYLEDMGSTNGTRINGFQLTAHQKYRLRDGDEVEFGRLRTIIYFKVPDTL